MARALEPAGDLSGAGGDAAPEEAARQAVEASRAAGEGVVATGVVGDGQGGDGTVGSGEVGQTAPVVNEPRAQAPATPAATSDQVASLAPEDATETSVVPLEAYEELGTVEEDGDSGIEFTFQPEYRVRSLTINPVELNAEGVRNLDWTEQRFRFDAGIRKPGVGAINIQLDALGGVLFGDNGSFIGSPAANSGVSLSAKRPNLTRWEMGLRTGGDPLDRHSYVPVLRDAPLMQFNYLYADIMLPVGLLRLGRQPMNYGSTITANDGGRHNRWGVAQYSDSVDRILFGTKLDQAWGVIRDGANHTLDASMDHGVIWGVFYDFMKQDDIYSVDDDLRQIGTQVQLRRREADWFGLDWRKFNLSGTVVHLRNDNFASRMYAFPMLFETQVENLGLRLQYTHIRGQTREISEGFAALTGREATLQDLRMHGAEAIVDVELGRTVWTMAFHYASGDDNPRPNDPVTSFSFARDSNVGLLMFEHVLAFESARSVAVGIENLSDADVTSFPLTEARTDGRLTNAIVVFPQLYIDWFRAPRHNVHTRLGVLMAWSAAKLGVIDPVMTSLNDVSPDIAANAVNYHGGVPARYYGTEIDVQLGYRFRDNFFWTLEAAMLMPGPGLWNEHGHAVRSFLVENRFELLF